MIKNPVSFAEVVERDSCRYIAGEKESGTDVYCGIPRQPGSAFCPDHHCLCHVQSRKEGE